MDGRRYAEAFDEVETEFYAEVARFGLPFEETESSPRELRLGIGCAHHENGDASLWTTWISPACLACRKGVATETFFVSLRCTRSCYFCFNTNQEDYAYHCTHERNIVAELEQAHAEGAQLESLAITGGEPMLHEEEVLAFIRRAKDLYPGVHVRIYTSGDLLTEQGMHRLADAGLDEIRFSVKPRETDGDQEELLALMGKAVGIIPDVLVEMPVIPGTTEEMEELLLRLDELGLRGINLLEFCFPLGNAGEFAKRGFKLRRKPYKVLYNYWYAGGLPIAGSEAEALELVRFAVDRGLRLGVHYCSLDNKHTGQIYRQDEPFGLFPDLAALFPWLSMDPADHFLKCAKVFGGDVERALAMLGEDAAVSSTVDRETPCLSFPLALAGFLGGADPALELYLSTNVLEFPEDGEGEVAPYIRELGITLLS